MKKFLSFALCTAICLSLCSCGGIKNELTEQSWVNVNDGDTYTFTSDGKGTHDGTEISYVIEDNTVLITEGASAATPRKFTFSGDIEPKKLIPENAGAYYVTEPDYETVGAQVRSENIAALVSYEFWESASGSTAYMSFFENGGGLLVLVGNTMGIDWEMIDNNTFTSTIDYNGQKSTSTLNIVNNDGTWQLVDSMGKVMWIPHN